MPELPEVETVRLQLQKKVIGKTIKKIDVLNSKSTNNDTAFANKLTNKTIANIDRVGKLMIFSFLDESNLFMLAHLKMTGQFFYVGDDGVAIGGGHSIATGDRQLPGRHTRVAFHFSDNTSLFFNDMRLFGYTRLATAEETTLARARFGPEPISPDFDCEWFTKKLQARKTSIKAVLLDQKFVSGLGNIYVDEALWRAKVLPTRPAHTITRTEASLLCRATSDVMNESIAVGGTTFQHFVDTDGKSGNFTDYLKVFGQQGKICDRCGKIIRKIRCAGRGTHYCPGCQK